MIRSYVQPGKLINTILRNGISDWHIDKSLMHTHCRGLHSIVIDVGPPMVRMYYASIKHELWRNDPLVTNQVSPCRGVVMSNGGKATFPKMLSIAIHPHRRDILLLHVFGTVINHAFALEERHDVRPRVALDAYRYVSPILQGTGEFTRGATVPLVFDYSTTLHDAVPDWARYGGNDALRGQLFLPAKALHTVYVPRGETAAWLVEEGDPDPEYDSTCFSNDDLSRFDFSGMYEPMDWHVARNIVDECIERRRFDGFVAQRRHGQ